VRSNPKQPSCTKVRHALCKKMWNPRWRPGNGCGGRLTVKILIKTAQVNFVPNPSETWQRQHKFTWIIVISLPSRPFPGSHLVFLWPVHFFLQLGCFGLDHIFWAWSHSIISNLCIFGLFFLQQGCFCMAPFFWQKGKYTVNFDTARNTCVANTYRQLL